MIAKKIGEKDFSADGRIWLSQGGNSGKADRSGRSSESGGNILNESRMALLDQIARTGSITSAGKAMGISYRTAWLTVDHLNGIADGPLVERTKGGKSGGGTRLTPAGEGLLRMYRVLQQEHGRYLERLREGIHDFDRFLRLTRKIALKTSARNQLFGVVESIRKDALNATVVLRLKGKDRLASRITLEGLESLGLEKGEEAYALIKANWISLSAGKPALGKGRAAAGGGGAGRTGENRLPVEIVSVKKGAGNAEAVLRLAGGSTLIAMIPANGLKGIAPGTSGSAGKSRQKLKGAMAVAVFKASNVILGVAR